VATRRAWPAKIGDILARIVDMTRTTFAEKHLNLFLDTHIAEGGAMPQTLGDAMFCYSLFQNLVKNACEAAPENTKVLVELHAETPVRIVVANKGVVPKEIRVRFFDKFVTQGKQGGTGLGTYSAKLLAEAQGGSIKLAVSDEKDTTAITVTLPRAT